MSHVRVTTQRGKVRAKRGCGRRAAFYCIQSPPPARRDERVPRCSQVEISRRAFRTLKRYFLAERPDEAEEVECFLGGHQEGDAARVSRPRLRQAEQVLQKPGTKCLFLPADIFCTRGKLQPVVPKTS